jgi:hypothetical protein
MHSSSLFASPAWLFMLIAACASYKPPLADPKGNTGEQELRKQLQESVATAERDLKLLRDILKRP